MRIAIDASRTTRARMTGTEHYALELIRALVRLNDTLDDPHRLFLYFNQPPADGLIPRSRYVAKVIIPMPRLWTHIRFASEIWKHPADVVWVPAHGLPFIMRGNASVTVHDLGFKHYPQAHPWRQRLALEAYTRYSANRATLVMADSKATRDDLHRFYNIPIDKIRVVYPGVHRLRVGSVTNVRAKYHLPRRYWLYLGTLQPRKNIQMIVEAYLRWRDQHNPPTTALVLAGGKGWKFRKEWAQAEGVMTPGYIDEGDKGALYRGALGLLFPSLYEGFGFPVIEAMGVGTPVICSNTSSLPELGGEAALYVDPTDADDIAAQMARLDTDKALHERLVRQGRQRAARFTWEDAAWDALLALEAAGKYQPTSRVKQL
jgi:glycosyltransferase involved in cell wall biosynthesis